MTSREAQQAWAQRSLRERAQVLRALRKGVLRHSDRLTDVVVHELGKLPNEARLLDVIPAAIALSWASVHGPRALSSSIIDTFAPRAARKATSTWAPRGVCALISPWNYPYAIPMGTIAAALIGGNAVVWKPSPYAMASSRALLDVLHESGLPAGLVTIVDNSHDDAADKARAVIDGDVDHVTFIGGAVAGRDVAARCGARLIPHIVELGGKAPAVVLASANVERAARAIVFGGLANAGQSCVAVERVYVDEAVADAVIARVRVLAAARPVGRVVLRGHSSVERVVDVTDAPDSPLLHDECFGPVLPCVRFARIEDAIDAANAHENQLAAYVFGARDEAKDIAARLVAPMTAVNDVMIHYALPQLPFGGVRSSGYGRVHGDEGLRALCVERVTVEVGRVALDDEPWWRVDGDGSAAVKIVDAALTIAERL